MVRARKSARELASKLDFSRTDLTLIATAVSEIARNIVRFAGKGQLYIELVDQPRPGIRIVARDTGPGIPDIDQALADGYSTYNGLGLGLPGARRLMDEFTLTSEIERWHDRDDDQVANGRMNMTQDSPTAERLADDFPTLDRQDEDQLLPQLVAHLREHRSRLREEWANRIHGAHLLEAMTPQETADETTSVYDNYVEVLETGSVEALQHYARDLSERIIPRGVETHEVVGIVLLLRDVLARSLFEKYQRDFGLLNRVLDAYEPAANRIANTVAVSFVEERERIIRQQQDSIRELSTPVLPVRERLLILPIIGILDTERARQLTEQLLTGIRTHRARVVVIDVTGAPDVDEAVANHLVRTVDASRLMGASVIITGLSPKIAQTLVTIGVDLSKMHTIGDLQGGLEEAERLLGYNSEQDGTAG